jgi:peroxiredoxin
MDEGVIHTMNMKKTSLIILLVMVITATGLSALDVGDEAASFVLPGLDKSYVYSKNIFNGENWVLLDFYATTCENCNEKLPVVEELYLKYQNTNFTCLLIATDAEGTTVVKPFFQSRPTPLTILVDRYQVMAGKYGVENIPTVFLVNPDGRIEYRLVGKSDTMVDEIEGFLSGLNG